MAKIMIVEHDSRQIEWAKVCLRNEHELLFAPSWCEFWALTGSEMDLIISDPLLPDHMGGKPSVRNGLEVFKLAFYLLTNKRIKGLALVTDHARNLKEYSLCLGCIAIIISETGKIISIDESGFYFLHKAREPLNVIVTLDAFWPWMPLTRDIHILDPDGNIITPKDIERPFFKKDGFIDETLMLDKGYVLPKPYPEIVNALLAKKPGALRRKRIKL